MAYYINKTVKVSFDEAVRNITEALKKEGFGIITEIDVKKTIKEKLGEEMRPYKILGACNPKFAFSAISIEDKIGTMLPCNVIVRSIDDETTEVAAINPAESMKTAANEKLAEIGSAVAARLSNAVNSL